MSGPPEATKDSPRFVVSLDGIQEDSRDSARDEISRILASLADGKTGVTVEVRVPEDFNREVNDLLVQKRGVKIEYSARRRDVMAIGKTIPILEGERLKFVIFFDPAIFASREPGEIVWRLGLFSHEQIHVLDLTAKYARVGADRFFAEPTTTRDTFLHLAHDTLMEYRAERWSIESLVKAVKSLGPDASVSFPIHEGHLNSFASAMQALPDFITSSVSSFRTWQTSVDTLWQTMYLRMWEVLSLAAYVYAHDDALSTRRPALTALESTPRYNFFFESWRRALPMLRSMSAGPIDYDETRLWEMGENLIALFGKCGLSFSDVPAGLYISVGVPNLA